MDTCLKNCEQRGEKKADPRSEKVIRNAVLRGRQGILERYILERYFRLSERCRQVRKK